MAQQGLATQSDREATPAIRVGTLSDEIKQMFDSISRRAFQIFQSNGGGFGHELRIGFRRNRSCFTRPILTYRNLPKASRSAQKFLVLPPRNWRSTLTVSA
jgi:hypothetical protein